MNGGRCVGRWMDGCTVEAYMGGWAHGWMGGPVDGWIEEQINVWVGGWMETDVCVDGWMRE